MLIVLAVVIGIAAITIAPFLVLTPRAPKPPDQLASLDQLETYLAALTANETPPALDVVVMKNGTVVYSRVFGIADGPARKPATPDGIYHFWSVTKLFTATAILQLAEDGRLALDDTVTKYLPNFRTVLSTGAVADISIRQLLDHTSGMKNLGPRDLIGWIHHIGDPPVSQTALVRDRMQPYKKLGREPGTAATYSNAGYIVLSAIIEAVAGVSYESFVRQRILRPLRMTDTDFIYRADLLSRAVSGSHPLFQFFTPLLLAIHHDWFSRWVGKTEKQRMWLVPFYTDYTGPTGLIGTSQDLARFGQAFLVGGELDGNRILKRETVSSMLNDGYGGGGPDGEKMGRGWHWWDGAPMPFKGHGGEGPGFAAQLAIFPDRHMVIAILANDTLIDRVALTNLVAEVFK